MQKRFKTLYRKPKTLTDRYEEASEEAVKRLLAKPEESFGWKDFNLLYRVGVAAASYQEGLYFLPEALAFLRNNPKDEALSCVADIVWFLSSYASQLEKDVLLHDCRLEIQGIIADQTKEFVILHWDRETSPEMCGSRDYRDSVQNSDLVTHLLEALLRFDTLGSWATDFLEELASTTDDPVRSAWYLECIENAMHWGLFRRAGQKSAGDRMVEQFGQSMPQLQEIWEQLKARGHLRDYPSALVPERPMLDRHAGVIRKAGDLFSHHPSYWADLFRKLELD